MRWFSRKQEIDWDAAYRAELPRVYNFFLYQTASREIAEDFTSMTFERAWKIRNRYDPERASITTWLIGIGRKVAAEQYRKRRVEVDLDSTEHLLTSDSAEEEAERKRQIDFTRAAVANLPDRERELISLKYGAGMTNRAIAQVVGLSESNVGSILHRTVRRLRQEVQHG